MFARLCAVVCAMAACVSPALTADYKVDGNRLIVAGTFYTDREFDRFAGYVRDNPAVDTIVLKDFSGGLRMSGFLNFTKFIRDSKLATEVDGPCISACALAFIGGVRRGLAPNADPLRSFIAFHGIYRRGGKLYEQYEGTYVPALRRYTGGRMPEALAKQAFNLPQAGFMAFFDSARHKRDDGTSVVLCDGSEARKTRDCKGMKGIDTYSTGVFTR